MCLFKNALDGLGCAATPQEETKEQKKEKTEKTAAERTVDDVEPDNKDTFDPEDTYHKGQFALRYNQRLPPLPRVHLPRATVSSPQCPSAEGQE